ncbi:MAG: tetratricopeptide repeat protein [Deltaproteobacteria bacterium]|nr:tetratricopeptide repeat protein [Deltaproteobacteria bacterium]
MSQAVAAERFRGAFGDMVPLSTALLETSREASGEASLAFADLAAEAAPRDPRPRARLLSPALVAQRTSGAALRDLWALAASLVSDPWLQVGIILRLAVVAWAAAVLSAVALAVAAAPACGALLLHDYSDAFPRPLRRFTPLAFAVVVAVVLRGTGAGVGFFGGVVALALCAYLGPIGRWALGISLGFACLLYPSLDGAARTAGPQGQRAWALYRVAKGGAGPGLEHALSQGDGGRSPDVLEARSRLAQRAGRYGEAIAWLQQALEAGAPEGEVRLEIGNLFFLQGRFAEAAAQYERASAANPNDPRPWLNLHVVNLKRLALAEADRALERARALDPSALERFQEGQGRGGELLLPVMPGLRPAAVRDALWKPRTGGDAGWPEALWQALVLPVAALRPVFWGVGLLLVTTMLGRGRAQGLTRRCPSCGDRVCPRCSRRVKGADYCPACWAILTQKDGDSAERARRQQVIAAWRIRATAGRRAAGVLLPGWGDVAFEGAASSLALGVAWSVAGGTLVAHALYPAPLLPWGGPGFPWVAVLLLAATHVWGARRALGRRLPAGRR